MKPLRGDGLLSDDAWIDFLTPLGRGKKEGRFAARNVVLDEGVREQRARSYREAGALIPHADYQHWLGAHWQYLLEHVFLESDDEGPPEPLDPEIMPESFAYIDPQSPFLQTNGKKMLLRVETLSFIAHKSGYSEEQILQLARQVLDTASPDPQAAKDLEAVFDTWFRALEQWPVFAAFWEDQKGVFGADPSADREDWADTLRDRLGLAHLNPAEQGPIDVLVFRYPVKHVPRLKLGAGRPLVVPTVLDGKFSEAFCPSPKGQTTGHVVNLAPSEGNLRREVLHPRGIFKPEHLFRVGTIRSKVNLDELPEQRGIHLLTIRDQTDRGNYAEGTDADLL